MPNFDETSLNSRNVLLTRKPSTSDNSKLKPKALSSLNEKTSINGSQLPKQSGLYPTVSFVPDSSTVSLPGYNRQCSENEQSISNMLERLTPDDMTMQANSTGISEQFDKAYPYRTTGDNSSKTDGRFPISYLLDGPSLAANNGIVNKQIFDEEKMPHYGVLEPENQNITDKTEIKSNADHSVSKLNVYKSDVHSENDCSSYDSLVKCNTPPEQAETGLNSATKEDQKDKNEKVSSSNLTDETISKNQIDLQDEVPRKRLESRSVSS
mgnify:CR=1 FL=1